MKRKLSEIIVFAVFLTATAAVGVNAQIAAGGTYTLEQAVVAGGGGTSTGGAYTADGTAGQTAAGDFMYGGPYVARSGFWNNLLTPTAASALIEGRVVDLSGKGLNNITVVLTGAPLTAPRTIKTNAFGNFSFDNVEVGQTYLISVSSRKYGFGQNTRVISLTGSVSDIVFQSTWEN